MAQARLDVKVTGDSSGALRAINAVRAAGDEFANKFREQSKEAVGQIVHMINPVILATTAIVAGVAKIGEAIRNYFEEGREAVKKAGEELNAAAKHANLTAEAYQKIRAQAELAGVSVSEFNAEMERLKSGQTTVSELADKWEQLPQKINLSVQSIKTLQFEAQAMLNAENAAFEKRRRNESGLTTRARFVGEAQARLMTGEDLATVQRELIDKYAKADWYTLGFTDNSSELYFAMQDIQRWQQRQSSEEFNAKMEAERKERERLENERVELEKEEAAEVVRQKNERREEWNRIRAAGGVEAFAVGVRRLIDPKAQLEDEGTQVVLRYWRQRFEALDKEFGVSPEAFAKQWRDEQALAQKEADEKRKADEKRQKETADRKAKEEERQGKIADVKEWARLAREEAQGSYRGGYDNSFGLMAGAGDLIGAGRYRAVTRMTEAAKLLKVNEQVLEINKQMNEKLKALEEG